MAHAGDYSACSHGGQTTGFRWLVLGLAILVTGCVHPPESRFPAVLQGPLLLSGAAFEMGTAAADAPLGPLELKRAWVREEGGDALWHVAVANPTSSGFGVTVVVRLLDPSGETAASDAISFELGRGAEREVESTVAVATSETASTVASWRIEAWVRVLPAPDRRTLGGTG